MVLNYIWIAFFVIAFVVALFRFVFFGDFQIFSELTQSAFAASKTGFEISLWLTGVMALWLGIIKIGEKGGAVALLSKWVAPVLSKLFPDVPKNHPVMGSMVMNLSANMLNLDNVSTPIGLKAMEQLQELNPNKEEASNAQIMFMVLNAGGFTLIPVSIMVFRSQLGAANPADVFIPILIATLCGTLGGVITAASFQKLNLFNKTLLTFLLAIISIIGLVIWYFSTLTTEEITTISSAVANLILFSIIIGFIVLGVKSKINVYDAFIEGAKDGFNVAVRIIPYLVAMLAAIAVFRTCGALDIIVNGIQMAIAATGLDTGFTPALPVAFLKPLSGSGARALMVDTLKVYGADSFVGRVASVVQGSTETTFYVLAVYFGSVNIKRTRYAVACGLVADVCGLTAAIALSYLFFG